jgi:septum site-determining protein MinC
MCNALGSRAAGVTSHPPAALPSWVAPANNVRLTNREGTFKDVDAFPLPPLQVVTTKATPDVLRVSGIVRTGSVIEHDGCVIIEGTVHSGAEIRATGDIHVYGLSGGRLFAGCHGNRDACLYLHRFDAELVSIASRGRVFEEVLPRWQSAPTKISLDPVSNVLRFEALTTPGANHKRAKLLTA